VQLGCCFSHQLEHTLFRKRWAYELNTCEITRLASPFAHDRFTTNLHLYRPRKKAIYSILSINNRETNNGGLIFYVDTKPTTGVRELVHPMM